MAEETASTPTLIDPGFIHLRVHTAYSLLEGAIKAKALPKLCVKFGFPAVGITDTNNMFGALELSEGLADAGVQPIPGVQLGFLYATAERMGERGPDPAPIALYAKDAQGYANLMALASRAHLEAGDLPPHVTLSMLRAHAEGIICLTGGPNGPIGQLLRANKYPAAERLLQDLHGCFGDRLYVELQRHGTGEALRTEAEALTEPGLLALAYAHDLPIVATNDVYFAEAAFYDAHDAMLCIAQGRYVPELDRPRLTPEYRFKTAAEMRARFADLPEACDNTIEIARRCAYRPRSTKTPILPRFAEDEVAEFRRQSREGLAARLAAPGFVPAAERAVYDERLEFEISVIEKMKFPGYFLIVADFIKWAKAQGIPVGPGRGSGAGSLVAWALTITDLDPLRYGLLFERFLNPERVSMPDFDIDFCQDRRDEVIRYVQRRYGRERVAQIITFGQLQARAAIRDVGRVLQMSYSHVDRLSKLVPAAPGKVVTLEEAIKQEPKLQQERDHDPTVARMLDIAQTIEGLYRHASTHAAGVVIGNAALDRIVPLYRDPKSDMPVTQFNMKWVEPAGLVKFDFLGLKTLTVIRNAVGLLAERGVIVDIDRIPLDDPATYALYGRADTVAVFQVESAGMRDALRQLRPSCIEDIVALVALYRPGPMENIPKYCAVKHGLEKPNYPHPATEPILRETQGIIVYQEQVMQIAQVLAGYSLGGADMLRRAMGKKIREEMDKQRNVFVAGAIRNNIPEKQANEIFDLLAKFADYGFNKSHAAAYALVSYQTAYLKANYPVEFMAAVMNLDMSNTDKLAIYAQELRRLQIKLLPPDVNQSGASFTVQDGAIRYALGAIKNVGIEAMRKIVAARQAAGPFRDLADFCRRVDLKAVGKRALENLIRAGALDGVEGDRRSLLAAVDELVAWSAIQHEEAASSQNSLFAGRVETPPPRLRRLEAWPPTQRLQEEFAAIGFYVTGHPLDDYLPPLRRKGVVTVNELQDRLSGARITGRVAALITARQDRRSQKSGNRFAYVMLSAPDGMQEAVVFSEALQAADTLLTPGQVVVAQMEIQKEGEQLRYRLLEVQAADAAAADAAGVGLRVFLRDATALAPLEARLRALRSKARSPQRGEGPVHLVVSPPEVKWEAEVALPGFYQLGPQATGAIKAIHGVAHVEAF